MRCAECSTCFKPKQHKQLFCKPACAQRFHNRNGARGKILAPLVMAQREGRTTETAKLAHAAYCRLCADWRDEDKAAGRMAMHAFVEHQFRQGIGVAAR